MARPAVLDVLTKQLEEAEAGLLNLEKEYLHLRGQWEGKIAAIRDVAGKLIDRGSEGKKDGRIERDETDSKCCEPDRCEESPRVEASEPQQPGD